MGDGERKDRRKQQRRDSSFNLYPEERTGRVDSRKRVEHLKHELFSDT